MENKIFNTINKFNMIKKGDSIVIGVSGGADSMALLSFFISIQDKFNLNIIVAHINHLLRGEESFRDENVVKNICKKNNIPFELLRADLNLESKKRNIGIEECGREIRYNFFKNIFLKYNANKIATAHTLSDNSETILMNITRGCSINGLCGIPAVRGNIIRPLIFLTRLEIEQYCKKNNIKYIIDSSNLSRDYTRNKIRLDIIPILKHINPSFENSIKKMILNISEDNKYLINLSREKYSTNIQDLKKLSLVLRSRIIIEFVKIKTKISLESKHVDLILRIIENEEGSVNIPKDYCVKVKNKKLEIEKIQKNKNKSSNWSVNFSIGDIDILENKKIHVKVLNYEEFVKFSKNDKTLFHNSLDYDIIQNVAVFRNRKEGDFFSPLKRNNTKKLKKFFNEIKVPIENRNKIILLAQNSEVLWIEGIGVSDKAKVKDTTKKVIVIT